MPSQQRKQPWHWHPLCSPILLPKELPVILAVPTGHGPNLVAYHASWHSHEACTRAIRVYTFEACTIAIQEYCWKETHMFFFLNVGGGIMGWKAQGKFCWLRVMSIQRGAKQKQSAQRDIAPVSLSNIGWAAFGNPCASFRHTFQRC